MTCFDLGRVRARAAGPLLKSLTLGQIAIGVTSQTAAMQSLVSLSKAIFRPDCYPRSISRRVRFAVQSQRATAMRCWTSITRRDRNNSCTTASHCCSLPSVSPGQTALPLLCLDKLAHHRASSPSTAPDPHRMTANSQTGSAAFVLRHVLFALVSAFRFPAIRLSHATRCRSSLATTMERRYLRLA